MVDHKNYLFILANQGAGGHRLGRTISTLDQVYWYGCKENGLTPDDSDFNDIISGKNISEYHYDRLVGDQMVPLVGERIELWWENKDKDVYYNDVWTNKMSQNCFKKILETQYLHWVIHDTPDALLKRFPNAKIISLIDQDITAVVDRFCKTTAFFPAYYNFPGLKPPLMNQYTIDVDSLEKIKPKSTLRDLWLYQHKKELNLSDDASGYKKFIKNYLQKNNNLRIKTDHPRHLKVTWSDINLKIIKDFLKN